MSHNKVFSYISEKRYYQFAKRKRRCLILECQSDNVFEDKNGMEFICLDCGFYWEIETFIKSKKA